MHIMQIFTELYDSRTCNNFSGKTRKGIENKLTQIKHCDRCCRKIAVPVGFR